MARLLSGYSRLPVELETRKSSKGNPCLCPILGQYLAELPPKRLDLSRVYLSIIFCGTTTLRCFIHDNDRKFTKAFDDVFQSKQIHVIHTPIEAPNANSLAERWVRNVREECLDYVLILNETHLRRVLQTYIEYYNNRRPHQSLKQQSPIPYPEPPKTGNVKRRQLLGGIINDYYRSPGNNALSPQLS